MLYNMENKNGEELATMLNRYVSSKEETRCFKAALTAFSKFDCEKVAACMNTLGIHFTDSATCKAEDIIGHHDDWAYDADDIRKMTVFAIKESISRWMESYDPNTETHDSFGCEYVNGGIFCCVDDDGFTLRFQPFDIWISNDEADE